ITQNFPGRVKVGTPGTPNFTPANITTCASDPVSFMDLSTFTPGYDHQWLWDFGDGSTSTEQFPTHEFQDTGSKVVRLTIFNNLCRTSITHIINVRPPIARFEYVVDCTTGLVSFANTSIVDPALALTYVWDFGPGIPPSNAATPAPINFPPGVHTVTL